MKIAFFSKDLPSDHPNGVSVQVDRLAEALVRDGHQVTCFTLSLPSDNAEYGIERLSSVGRGKLARKFVPALMFRSVDTSAFDIVHYHGDDYLCTGSRKRVRTFYGSAFNEALHATTVGRCFYQTLFYKFEWLSCLRQGTLVAISATTKKSLPLIPNIIPCGVPLDRFFPNPSLKTASPSILFIGDFKSRKQGDLLLRVFRETVLPAHPQTTLTVVGPESISAQQVRCLGRINEQEIVAEYQKAWIYCLPSSYEGFGVPAIEAMACGCAVAAVKNAGTRELVEHEKTGILCTKETLGASLKMLIADGPLRNRLIENGIEQATAYDIMDCAKRYDAIYSAALGKRG
jgi:phosphatidylinositol alpha-mannosyltransferase